MVRDIGSTGDFDRLYHALSTVDRYDFVLAIIPVALLGAVLAGSAFGLSLEAALLGGLSIALLAVLDGLFLRPPSGLQNA